MADERGHLKVFIGMAPGVGKTYRMLQEGRAEADNGRDVVIGYLETHGRQETLEQARELETVPRRVVSHRGLFSTSNHAGDFDVINARAALAPIFDTYRVDLVMNGHDHEYERSKPLTAGSPPTGTPVVQPSITQGTTYVINAGAGADPYPIGMVAVAYRNGDGVPLGVLLEAPLRDRGVEAVQPAVVGQLMRGEVVAGHRRAERQLGKVAQRRQRLRHRAVGGEKPHSPRHEGVE